MKNIITFYLLTIVTAGFFTSCKKESSKNNSMENNQILLSTNVTSSYSSSRTLFDSGALSAANYHNSYLDSALGDINIPNTSNFNYNSVVDSLYSNYYDSISLGGLTRSNFNSLRSYLINHPYVSYNSDVIDSEVLNKAEYYALIENLQTYLLHNLTSYSNLVLYVDSLKTDAYSNFTGTDLDAAIVTLETTKKSGYYWMSTSDGGSGVGYSFIQDYTDVHGLPLMSIKEVVGKTLLADGVSSGFTFLMIGFLAVPTPVTFGGLVLVVGLPAAQASIVTLLKCLAE